MTNNDRVEGLDFDLLVPLENIEHSQQLVIILMYKCAYLDMYMDTCMYLFMEIFKYIKIHLYQEIYIST
jgi:hypothetical protein